MKNTQDTPLGFVLNLFLSLPEPRRRYCRVYPLEMLLFCAMATFITGRKSFYDRRYFIISLPLGPQEIALCVREHWGVETPYHWSLEVIFNDDCCLARVVMKPPTSELSVH